MFLRVQRRRVTKWAQTTHLALFGPLVNFFHVLFILIIIFRQGWGGLGKAATMKIALKTGSDILHVFCSFCTMFYVVLFPSIVDC